MVNDNLGIRTSLKRCESGLHVNVHTTPAIEQAIKALGTGDYFPVGTFGRSWRSPKNDPLHAYHIMETPGLIGILGGGNCYYRMDALGQPLVDYTNYDSGVINLSFLRLVNTSEGEGISFILNGVYSADGISRLLEGIKKSIREFGENFLKPINMSVYVTIKEGANEVYRQ